MTFCFSTPLKTQHRKIILNIFLIEIAAFFFLSSLPVCYCYYWFNLFSLQILVVQMADIKTVAECWPTIEKKRLWMSVIYYCSVCSSVGVFYWYYKKQELENYLCTILKRAFSVIKSIYKHKFWWLDKR